MTDRNLTDTMRHTLTVLRSREMAEDTHLNAFRATDPNQWRVLAKRGAFRSKDGEPFLLAGWARAEADEREATALLHHDAREALQRVDNLQRQLRAATFRAERLSTAASGQAMVPFIVDVCVRTAKGTTRTRSVELFDLPDAPASDLIERAKARVHLSHGMSIVEASMA